MALGAGKHHAQREVDRPLNLIPFISLLSVVVCFLIAGAAWVQLAQIEIALPSQGSGGSDEKAGGELTLTIMLTDRQLQVAGSGSALPPIANLPDGEFDYDKLNETLKEIREKFPEQKDTILAVQASILYEKVVAVMDLCLKNGYEGISLAPYTPPWAIREALQKKK